MKLFCADCGELIGADNINLATGLAKCGKCDGVFNYAQRLKKKSRPEPADEMMPQPPQMTVQEWGGVTRIRWRWFHWSIVPLAGFCVFWDGFLVFWYTLAFAKNGPLMMKLFPVLHVAVGITLTYHVLTGFFNRTLIEVSDYDLSIHHGPLPWWGIRHMASASIGQLYCERSRRDSQTNSEPTYRLCATLGEGKTVRLIGGLRNYGEARFLEQTIEAKLEITPRAVVGECRE